MVAAKKSKDNIRSGVEDKEAKSRKASASEKHYRFDFKNIKE